MEIFWLMKDWYKKRDSSPQRLDFIHNSQDNTKFQGWGHGWQFHIGFLMGSAYTTRCEGQHIGFKYLFQVINLNSSWFFSSSVSKPSQHHWALRFSRWFSPCSCQSDLFWHLRGDHSGINDGPNFMVTGPMVDMPERQKCPPLILKRWIRRPPKS